ncbi:MAG: CDP-alcohol phosphatidyltransferase family protein [Muribaculaceae bacterium]|nr:CDP-alcohol phosphatidyltransferase family protein [Muribaculaceae bacterium]
MGSSSAKRIQTSLLGEFEKKLLIKIANRLPAWVTSDFLTWTGFFGAVICAVGYALGELNLNWLWLSSFGLFLNWFGDSLDGTVARVRHTQRPTYGFYIDHALDAFTISIMCIGAGLSPLFDLNIGLLVLAGYLVISIHTYLLTILNDEFRLTYGGFGPTEFRLVMVIMNTVAIYVPWQSCGLVLFHRFYSVFELLGIAIVILIWVLNVISFWKDLRIFAKKDPVKPYNPEA